MSFHSSFKCGPRKVFLNSYINLSFTPIAIELLKKKKEFMPIQLLTPTRRGKIRSRLINSQVKYKAWVEFFIPPSPHPPFFSLCIVAQSTLLLFLFSFKEQYLSFYFFENIIYMFLGQNGHLPLSPKLSSKMPYV